MTGMNSRLRIFRATMMAAVVLAAATVQPGAGGEPAASSWPMVQHDLRHTGRAGVPGPADRPTQRCAVDLTGSVSGSPVTGADGTIYVPSGDSDDPSTAWRLHALDPSDCAEKWSLPLPGWPGVTAPAVAADGTIYLHTNAAQNIAGPPHLLAVNPDGTLKWDLLYHGPVAALTSSTPSSPAVAPDGNVWIGASDTWVYAVRPGGDIACAVRSPTVSSIASSPAIASDGTVYVLDVTNELMAVSPTCELEWSLGLQPASGGHLGASVAIGAGETLYVPANEDLVAVSASGVELWRVDLGEDVSTPAIGTDGTVYVESDGLAAVDASGDLLWGDRACLDWTTGSGVVSDDAPLIGANGLVYYQQNGPQKMVCAYRPNGTRAWSLERAFGSNGGRLALTADGAIVDTEGGLAVPPRLGLLDSVDAVAFQQAARAVTESAGTVQLTVTRSGDTSLPATVTYSRTGGSATPGVDFDLAAGTLSFPAGQTSRNIPLDVVDDAAKESGETVTVSLSSPVGTALGSPAAMTVTIRASDQQPDGWVSTASGSGYVGNDVYNTSGSGQTKRLAAQRTETRTFYVRLYNDGNVANTFALKGSGAGAGATVRYLAGGADVTAAMRSASGWKVSLKPGAYKLVKTRIKVREGASIGSIKTAKVTGTWTGDGIRSDVVKAVVKVVR